MKRRWTTRLLAGAAAALVPAINVSSASASTWSVPLKASSSGTAHGWSLAAPTNVSAVCSGLLGAAVVVSWSAGTPNPPVTYEVDESTTSANGAYTAVVSNVPGLSWNSPVLPTGHYWFEVKTTVNNWTSVASAPTAQRSVLLVICT